MFLVILIPAFVFHTFALLVVRSGDAFLLFVALRDQKTGDRTALPYDDGHVLARDRVSATTRPVQPLRPSSLFLRVVPRPSGKVEVHGPGCLHARPPPLFSFAYSDSASFRTEISPAPGSCRTSRGFP